MQLNYSPKKSLGYMLLKDSGRWLILAIIGVALIFWRLETTPISFGLGLQRLVGLALMLGGGFMAYVRAEELMRAWVSSMRLTPNDFELVCHGSHPVAYEDIRAFVCDPNSRKVAYWRKDSPDVQYQLDLSMFNVSVVRGIQTWFMDAAATHGCHFVLGNV